MMNCLDIIFEVERLAYSGNWERLACFIEKTPGLATEYFGEVETTLLISICCFGNVDAVINLIGNGADPNYVDRAGQSALLSTIWGGVEGRDTFGVAQALIGLGADPELIVQSGYSVVDIARINGLVKYVELFKQNRGQATKT